MIATVAVWDREGRPLSAGKVQVVLHAEDGSTRTLVSGELREGALKAEVAEDAIGLKAKSTVIEAEPETAATSITTLSSATPTRRTVALADLVSGAGDQVKAANTSVASAGVTLGEVKLTIRGVATATEAGDLGLMLSDETLDAASLSAVETRYVPGTSIPSSGADAMTTVLVPDLRGYTRQVAERKLASLGFSAHFATIGVSTDADRGRVVRQSPPANGKSSPGATVRLFLGA